MKKRMMSLLLAGAMVVGLLPNSALSVFAEDEISYPVLGGVQFSEGNLTMTDTNGGTATYNPEEAILTLDNFTVYNEDGIGLYSNGDISLAGKGDIGGSTYGVLVDGTLSIEKYAKLYFRGEIAAMAVDGIGTSSEIISEPVNAELGGIDVGAEESYTTYGTNDEEYNFIPAKVLKYELGYDVSFDMGKSSWGIESQAVVADKTAVEPEDVPPYYDPYDESGTEYMFAGWYTDETYTTLYDFGTPVTENVEIYAKWVEVPADKATYPVYLNGEQFHEYKLTIYDNGNGGKGVYNPETNTLTFYNDYYAYNDNGEGLKFEGDLILDGNAEINGSTYGVYTDGNLEIAEGATIVFSGETAAMAIGGGIGTTNAVITEPENVVQGGIDVGAEEGYTTYGTYDEEYNFIPAETVKFEHGYTVFFNMNGSFNGIDEQGVRAGEKAVEPVEVPEYNDGESTAEYKFAGWYLDETCTIPYDFDTPVTNDVQLYAKWVKVSNNAAADDEEDEKDERNNYISLSEVKNKLNSTSKDTVTLNVKDGDQLSSKVFEELAKHPEKTLVLKGNGYTLSIKGEDIVRKLSTSTFDTDIRSSSPNRTKIRKLIGSDVEVQLIHSDFHGMLPGKMTLRIKVEDSLKGQLLYLHHYEEKQNILEPIASGLKADAKGYVEFSIDHFSTYILTDSKLNVQTTVSTDKINPSTGAGFVAGL